MGEMNHRRVILFVPKVLVKKTAAQAREASFSPSSAKPPTK